MTSFGGEALKLNVIRLGAWFLVSFVVIAFLFVPLANLFFQQSLPQLVADIGTKEALAALGVTAWTSLCTLLILLLFCTPVCLWLSSHSTPLSRFVQIVVQLPMICPPAVAGLALLLCFDSTGPIGGVLSLLHISIPFTAVAVILAQTFVSAPFYMNVVTGGLNQVDRMYVHISRTLGLHRTKRFWRVILPLSWPSFATGAAMAWARAVGEFGATMMFAGNLPGHTQTMPLAIYTVMQDNINVSVALSVILILVGFLILLTMNRIHIRYMANKSRGQHA